MPCYDPPMGAVERVVVIDKNETRRLTALLCEACGIIFEDMHVQITDGLRSWWKTHRQEDEARAKERKLQLSAARKSFLLDQKAAIEKELSEL